MKILITGSSGLIGNALHKLLSANGHQVFRMLRKQSPNEAFFWQPANEIIHLDKSIAIDAVIHLAGANIADGRWNAKKKKLILESRESGTSLLANAIAKLPNKPRVFISGSAIGFYGNTGSQAVDEESEAGTNFLANVCQKWERAALPAIEAGIRTVYIRIGIVLSPHGGALQKMLLPFKMGVGGVIGNGKQYMSWVGIDDVTNMIQYIMEHESLSGPVNLVAPNPVTNYRFTKTLGAVLKRPTCLPLPAFAARMLLGEMADALLLSSTRVLPKKLQAAGYKFIDEDLAKNLRSCAVKENKQLKNRRYFL